MRRVFLLFVIICMCMIVALAGTMTFLNSDGVILRSKSIKVNKPLKDLKILIDITENRLYLISEDRIIKSYPVGTGKPSTPSPIGDWIIVSKDNWGKGFGGYWMRLSVPWGVYGIHGTTQPGSIGVSISQGCIRMYNSDVAELYKLVGYGTQVKVYGGPRGPFGYGFRTLIPGDRGADVFEVQRRLKQLGYYNGSLDGKYGETMKEAVFKFQKQNGMELSNALGYDFYYKLGVWLWTID